MIPWCHSSGTVSVSQMAQKRSVRNCMALLPACMGAANFFLGGWAIFARKNTDSTWKKTANLMLPNSMLPMNWNCGHQFHSKQLVMGQRLVSPLTTSYGIWGSAVSSPAKSGAEPRKILNLVHFGTWKLHQKLSVINRKLWHYDSNATVSTVNSRFASKKWRDGFNAGLVNFAQLLLCCGQLYILHT